MIVFNPNHPLIRSVRDSRMRWEFAAAASMALFLEEALVNAGDLPGDMKGAAAYFEGVADLQGTSRLDVLATACLLAIVAGKTAAAVIAEMLSKLIASAGSMSLNDLGSLLGALAAF